MFAILLWTHIISGSLALISGSASFFQRKGGKSHVLLGRIFYSSMLLSAVVAVVMSSLRNNIILLVIGVFTIYLVLAGRNFLMIERWKPARTLGLLLSWAMVVATIVLLFTGLRHALGENEILGAILLGMGLISSFLIVQDFKFFIYKRPKPVTMHIGRMTGGWIASWTAFLVVNQYIPVPWLNWALPTFVGVPVIVFWIRKFEAR